MAKVKNVRGRKSLLSGWQTQTRDLLNKLLKERPLVAGQLAAIDDEIAMLQNALGRAAGSRPAARVSVAKKAAPKKRGGIAGAVLSVLAAHGEVSVQKIVEKTGLDRQQVYPCLMNLKSQKKIVAAARGSYRLTARGKSAVGKAKGKGKRAPAKKRAARKGAAKKAGAKKTKSKRAAAKGKAKGKGSRGPRGAVSGAVMKVLASNSKGVSRPKLISATGMDERQVSACIMNLKKAGKIKAVARGIYALA